MKKLEKIEEKQIFRKIEEKQKSEKQKNKFKKVKGLKAKKGKYIHRIKKST